MIKIGAGWDKYNENGEFISWQLVEEPMMIDLSKISLLAFRNREKREELQPDWNLFLTKKKER